MDYKRILVPVVGGEADETVDRTHRANAELLSERERLSLEHANVVEQLGDASTSLADSEERLKASAAEIGRLEQELNDIYESKAWKVASLRWRSG